MQNEFNNLTERQQKQLIFEIISRLNYMPKFYGELQILIEKYPSPFDESSMVMVLKPEYTSHINTN